MVKTVRNCQITVTVVNLNHLILHKWLRLNVT